MSESRRGRPARSKLERLQIDVSRAFDKFKTLRFQFEQSINNRYPNLSIEQRQDIRHTILGVADEYKLWSDTDNTLLTIQRSDAPEQKWAASTETLKQVLEDIASLYQLRLRANPELKGMQLLFNSEYFDYICLSNLSEHFEYELTLLKSEEQSVWLLGFCQYYMRWIDNPFNLQDLYWRRQQLRQLQLFIVRHRLALLYPIVKRQKPGRPEIPLPVLLLRAESELMACHLQYRQCASLEHVRSLSPDEIWLQFRRYLSSQSAGRKQYSRDEQLVSQRLQLSSKLQQLRADEYSPSTPSTPSRGRPKRAAGEIETDLSQQIADIDAELEKMAAELSSTEEKRAFSIRCLECEKRLIQRKLKTKKIDPSAPLKTDITDGVQAWLERWHIISQQLASWQKERD
ncbi:hypothetical protein [Thaumasiovibrio sp. DFM-14]|uniref:hypothetical protein n=1 Tax=Thaumasiovibrio sp. DFM-14 TaxID=3384792 RepID=UPI0039A2CBB2